jgi:ADP-ribosylglycohydrolase
MSIYIITDKQRVYGSFFGSVCSDCIGSAVEFSTRGSYPLVTDMVLTNYNFGVPLPPGCWTENFKEKTITLFYRREFI